MSDNAKIRTLGNFTWTIAELLRGDFKQFEYGKIILPFVVLRRLDCILEASKDHVLAAAGSLPDGIDEPTRDMLLFDAAGGLKVYNTSPLTFAKIKGQSPAQVHENLVSYVTAFSPSIRDVFLDKFKLMEQLKRLAEAELLWLVFERFTQIDLHPDNLSNLEMGYLFEDLIRRFSEISNETAGEHFTPREIVKLIVEMILANDHEALTGSGVIRTIYDPACGTGGMLALTEAELKAINPRMRVELYGQELNGESYAICKSDMLLSGHDPDQIAFGNTLSQDAHRGRRFHYMVSNPPYGVDWKKYADVIRKEAKDQGHSGRFGAGLPRQSDGQLLFLQHMIAKMRDDEVGSQIGIVMNGSPLFTGGAGSGESEIRRWLLENDWVEAIVALPTDIFYNTGIQTYVWLVTNRKDERRRGKVQLIDASSNCFWTSMRKSLGMKRREIPEEARREIVRIYADMLNGGSDYSAFAKILDVADFGYREIRVERPLRLAFEVTRDKTQALQLTKAFMKLGTDEASTLIAIVERHLPSERVMDRSLFDRYITEGSRREGLKMSASLKKMLRAAFSERDDEAVICRDSKGQIEPDPELRDTELVPLKQDWTSFFDTHVRPFVNDAWVDEDYRDPHDGEIGRVGYDLPVSRFFFRYLEPRPLDEIDADLARLTNATTACLQDLAA